MSTYDPPQWEPMSSAPPPGPAGVRVTLALAEPSGVKRLLGRRGAHELVLTPAEVAVHHASTLRAPLRFAPGSVALATVDPGAADAKGAGRFPVLRRLTADRVIPRDVGIEGWLWTDRDGSASELLGPDAPNLALLLSPPLAGERVTSAFAPGDLQEIAKRSPLGEPALVGLLLRVRDTEAAKQALARFGMLKDVTDRDVPPTQRRHLPGDKAADPAAAGIRPSRASGSVPPPGRA